MRARTAFANARGRIVLAAALVGGLALGCAHTRSVGPADAPKENEAPKEKESSKESEAPATAPHPKRVISDLKGPHGEPQNITIATSPGALLKPGAAKALQEKLSKEGELHGDVGSELDGRTRDALARFQRAHALPATGVPDDATVRKLGLKPGDVFRSGNDREGARPPEGARSR